MTSAANTRREHWNQLHHLVRLRRSTTTSTTTNISTNCFQSSPSSSSSTSNLLCFTAISTALLFILVCTTLPTSASCHGVLSLPPARGAVKASSYFWTGYPKLTRKLKQLYNNDFHVFFPAGSKVNRPGVGLYSQKVAGNFFWTPYEPTDRRFPWRAGVCGDVKGAKRPAHERGVGAHHNGFLEFWVCDVQKCNGEISTSCFQNGHCYKLNRAPNPPCDQGYSKRCGPIDRNHRSRWYLPCTSYYGQDEKIDYYGRNERTILYYLPRNLNCEHCVLQSYWASANSCNPPGYEEYFTGRDGPKNWGNCPGQGDARGGYARNKQVCGNKRFTEEYYTCHDIRILSNNNNNPPPPPPQQPPPQQPPPDNNNPSTNCNSNYNARQVRNTKFGGIKDIVLIGDGCRIASLYDLVKKNRGWVRVSNYKSVSIEAITDSSATQVKFEVKNKYLKVIYSYTDRSFPFHISDSVNVNGKIIGRNWAGLNSVKNKLVYISAAANKDYDQIPVTFS